MEELNNTVETLDTLESVVDDAPQAQEETSSLDTVVEEAAPQTEEAPAKEPGWIKQRVGKAVDKAVREAEQRVRAEYEAMLAPIRDDVMDRQARELVQSGEFKSLDRAKEYVRLKNGIVESTESTAQTPQPNRDEHGRFTAAEPATDPVVQARATFSQSRRIKSRMVGVLMLCRSSTATPTCRAEC